MTPPARRIGLVLHPSNDVGTGIEQVARWARSHDAAVVVPTADAGRVPEGVEPVEPDDLRRCDALVSLGGDGTMLGALRLVADDPRPVLGVNFGHLGFLAEVEPEELPAALDAVAAGAVTLEKRSALRVHAAGDTGVAFNDVALARVPGEGSVHALLTVNGHRHGFFRADAVIVATPTGSTAYAYAAGGPVVSPAADAMVVTAAAPMSGISRPLVLGAEERITLELAGERAAPAFELDGRVVGNLAAATTVDVAVQRDAGLIVRVDGPRHEARSRVKLSLLDLPLLPDELVALRDEWPAPERR